LAKPEIKAQIEADIEALRTAYVAEAESRFNAGSTEVAEARILINRWAQYAQVAAAAASGLDVSSYSIGGRSVTKNDIGAIQDKADGLLDQVKAMLGKGGGALRADLREALV